MLCELTQKTTSTAKYKVSHNTFILTGTTKRSDFFVCHSDTS